jgi:hypothetical protein
MGCVGMSKQDHERESRGTRRPKAEEIASALRESAATPAALVRRREQQLLTTLKNLMESADNREIFVKRVRETFKLREDDPRWKAILAVWDEHLNPGRQP